VIRLLYRIDLPNAVLATVLLKQCLAVLSGPFSDLRVTTDRANFNAARTGSGGVRWPGKRTGPGTRRSAAPARLQFPVWKKIDNIGLFEILAANSPRAPVEIKGYMNIINLPDWLREHDSFVKSEKPCEGARFPCWSSARSRWRA
jgi:hypothetical protein